MPWLRVALETGSAIEVTVALTACGGQGSHEPTSSPDPAPVVAAQVEPDPEVSAPEPSSMRSAKSIPKIGGVFGNAVLRILPHELTRESAGARTTTPSVERSGAQILEDQSLAL